MGEINIHVVECPYCSHEFYTQLPDGDEEKEIGCVECDDPFGVEYEFEEREEQIEVEITLSTLDKVTENE